jgi:hypothetical protein
VFRVPATDGRRLLDHRPARGHELQVAGPAIVPLQAPGDDRRLVHRGGFPLRPAVDRVLLVPVGERPVLAPDLREPLQDAPADLGMAEPLERAADPDRVARPAVGVQAPVEPRGDGPPVGVGVQGGGQGRAAEADGVARLGEVRAGQGLDVGVPLLRRHLLNLVEVSGAEPGQGGTEPVLESPRVAPPAGESAANQQIDRHRLAHRQVEPAEQDRLVRPGRLAVDVPSAVERDGEFDRRVPRQLAVGVPVAPVHGQERPVAVVPAQARLADPAVDLRLDIDAEQRPARLVPLVLDPKPLEVLPRRDRPPGRPGQALAHRDEVGGQHPDRPVSPGQLGHQQVGRPLVVLEGLPAQPLGEPVEPPPDRQAADDRPEVRAALQLVPLRRPDVRVQPHGREVDVVGRTPRIDPGGHHPVADQSLGVQG